MRICYRRAVFRCESVLAGALLSLFVSSACAADVSYIIQQAETGFFFGGQYRGRGPYAL